MTPAVWASFKPKPDTNENMQSVRLDTRPIQPGDNLMHCSNGPWTDVFTVSINGGPDMLYAEGCGVEQVVEVGGNDFWVYEGPAGGGDRVLTVTMPSHLQGFHWSLTVG